MFGEILKKWVWKWINPKKMNSALNKVLEVKNCDKKIEDIENQIINLQKKLEDVKQNKEKLNSEIIQNMMEVFDEEPKEEIKNSLSSDRELELSEKLEKPKTEIQKKEIWDSLDIKVPTSLWLDSKEKETDISENKINERKKISISKVEEENIKNAKYTDDLFRKIDRPPEDDQKILIDLIKTK